MYEIALRKTSFFGDLYTVFYYLMPHYAALNLFSHQLLTLRPYLYYWRYGFEKN